MGIFRFQRQAAEVAETVDGTDAPAPAAPTVSPDSAPAGDQFIEAKPVDEKTLVLDGPLGQVYTQALNQVYAKEANATEYDTIQKALGASETADAGSYLYVTGASDLDGANYVEAFESLQLASTRCKKLYVCVEHEMQISDRVGQFLTYARECGAVVFWNRQKAIDAVIKPVLGLS